MLSYCEAAFARAIHPIFVRKITKFGVYDYLELIRRLLVTDCNEETMITRD